ncbi:MAG: hypothetical protein JNL08_06920 [Planctomycetes bacterium]|nr:hypothetical protein [Planctomycetota bacterium]
MSATLAAPLSAQCTNVWLPGAVPGVDGGIFAAVQWDPDGVGPVPPRLVIAGTFTQVDGVPCARIAMQDPVTGAWSPLGAGLDQGAWALCALPNGDLVVGGWFAHAGGTPAAAIARWDGTTWWPFGTGASSSVDALTVLANGDLVAGGSFQTMDGVACGGIARWNGATWASLGFAGGLGVRRLLATANGDLVVAGAFAQGGLNRIARWNGTTWSNLGGGASAIVFDVVELGNGDLLAGGNFAQIGGQAATRLARWNGSAWSAVPSSFGFGVWCLQLLANGDVLAIGAPSNQQHRIDRWDGVSWTNLGSGPGIVSVAGSLELANGDLVVAGPFTDFAGVAAPGLARWSPGGWSAWWTSSAFGAGFDGSVKALAVAANGDVVAAGSFVTAGGVVANRIARWDGTAWTALGSGLDGPANAAVFLPDGSLVVAGSFTTAGGVPAAGLAIWDGVAWSQLGGGVFLGEVQALAVTPDGYLVAGGRFTPDLALLQTCIALWDGASWSALGSGITGASLPVGAAATVNSLAVLANGDLVAGGLFTEAGGAPALCIARWNGIAWSQFGAGANGSVLAFAELASGDLIVGGAFDVAGGAPASRIAFLHVASSTWVPLGGGTDQPVRAVAVTPNGDVIAAGDFTIAGGTPASRIARWNGNTWSPIAGADWPVYCLQRVAGDDLVAAGDFTTVGGVVSPRIARLTTTCPASAVAAGLGCPSSGGNNLLVAASPPWVDATFHTVGTGLPTVAIVATLTSFSSIPQGAVPLALAFPQAGPGCDVLVAPDILGALVTTTGSAASAMYLPNVPPLVGMTFFHQMVPIELDGSGAWVSVTATNALSITPGAF